MKRLGVFQLFDVDGIISNYIYFLLDDLRKNVDDLMVIVCGEINGDSIDKLKKYTDRVYYRKNYGFDAYAFKDFFTKFIDINELQKYDELVLLNDTFYGPFYPFEQVFKEMAEESVDFWGLTMHKKTYDLEEHLQSFFIVIRKKMFLSHYFNEFWENLKLEKVDFYHLVHNYEVKFTQFFKEQGFSYSAYVKDDILNSDTLNNYNHYAYSPFQLIKYFKMPIIKRKVFTEGKDLSISAGEEIPEAFKYIKNHYNYDTDLIWEDLLRKYRLYDIKKQLNLNFVLPTKGNESHKKINKKIAVIAHLVYEDQLEKCKEYLYNIPNEIDIIITSYNDTILESLEKEFKKNERNMHTIKVINRGRDVAAIFVACKEIVKNYEYINSQDEEEQISNDIFRRMKSIKVIDPYAAYQILDNVWRIIQVDLEILQTEGESALSVVDPHMITKKKDDEEIEVQDGWEGHLLPFELVQKMFLQDELTTLEEKEAVLSDLSSVYEEVIDSLAEDEQEGEYLKDGNFISKEVKVKVEELLADIETDEILALQKYLSLSKKKEKMEFVAAHNEVDWASMPCGNNGTYTKIVIIGRINELKKDYHFDEDSFEYKMVTVLDTMEKESALKKEVRNLSAALHAKTKEMIEHISREDAFAVLSEKWLTPIVDGIADLPDGIIDNFIARLMEINNKYVKTFSEVGEGIESSEKRLIGYISDLRGDDYMMRGFQELMRMLKGAE